MGYHRQDKEMEEIEGQLSNCHCESSRSNLIYQPSECNMRLLAAWAQGLAPLQEQAARNDMTKEDCLFQ
jgi:hypothetical protein